MAENRRILNIPLNRVEGDLELQLEYDGDTVTNAWSCGIMYRGFENMLKGRSPRDSLVLTPRVCGICGTAHLMAAAQALDMLCEVTIPDNAVLVRNLALAAEHIQSDIRHNILMFMRDFLNPVYRQTAFFAEACRRYEAFRGESVLETIRETKKILEIVAIVGGQWPNSSFMVPGGVATAPTFNDLVGCTYIQKSFRSWYERRILGCNIDRWAAVTSRAALDAWLDEAEDHRQSDLGFFIQCARATGIDTIGRGHENFLSAGFSDLPDQTGSAPAPAAALPSGCLIKGTRTDFSQTRISEHVAFSRFQDFGNGRHPFEGVTLPDFSETNREKYSWAKAPRYDDIPMETGPLAELLVAEDPLLCDLVQTNGPSPFTRELARLTRPARLLPLMKKWIKAINPKAPYYTTVKEIPDGRGYGLIEACRGVLGHWVEIREGVIDRYQIITPTSWNGSPRDSNGIRGPWEEAVVGTRVHDPENPVEIGHIVRSFDACLVCAVHRCTHRLQSQPAGMQPLRF